VGPGRKNQQALDGAKGKIPILSTVPPQENTACFRDRVDASRHRT
jgi:hypothetical protein